MKEIDIILAQFNYPHKPSAVYGYIRRSQFQTASEYLKQLGYEAPTITMRRTSGAEPDSFVEIQIRIVSIN